MKISRQISTQFLFCAFILCMVWHVSSCAQQADHAGETTPDPKPAAYALDGQPLFPPAESPESLRRKDSLLRIAEDNYRRDATQLDNIIWYGRRLAYLSRFDEAIDVFTKGLQHHANAPELLRHRGHRYITLRKFDNAIGDLTTAADAVRGRPIQIEPDGVPNRYNTPLSNLQFNIWYHLALAHFLKGDYAEAEVAYDSCKIYLTNPDLLVAFADWYYMTLVRLGKTDEAALLLDAITPDLEIVENGGYFNRLMMYKGEFAPEILLSFDQITEENELTVVTQGYGAAFYYEMQGDTARARAIREQILKTSYWAAFGYIAAEADQWRAARR